ncbi:MAG: hypothetical protein PUI01_07225 [Campylobacteraceae bacterium]|nr:hypothetical protein [Campylobacteraceae bacterium]
MNSSLRNSRFRNSSLGNSRFRNSRIRGSGCKKLGSKIFFASHPLVASHPLGERFLVLKPLR